MPLSPVWATSDENRGSSSPGLFPATREPEQPGQGLVSRGQRDRHGLSPREVRKPGGSAGYPAGLPPETGDKGRRGGGGGLSSSLRDPVVSRHQFLRLSQRRGVPEAPRPLPLQLRAETVRAPGRCKPAGRPPGRRPHPPLSCRRGGVRRARSVGSPSSLRPETRQGLAPAPSRVCRSGGVGGAPGRSGGARPLPAAFPSGDPRGETSENRRAGGGDPGPPRGLGARPGGRREPREGGESEGRREKGGKRRGPARPGGKRNRRFFKVRRTSSSKPAQRHFQETAGAAGSASDPSLSRPRGGF